MSPNTTPSAPRASALMPTLAPCPPAVPWPPPPPPSSGSRSCPTAAAGAVSPRSSARMSPEVGRGAVPPSAVVTSASRLIVTRRYCPLHRQEAAQSGWIRQRLRLAHPAAHHQRAHRRCGRGAGPGPTAVLDELVDA